MADFLSRLAGQALGRAPAIQPLGTPLYALAGGMPGVADAAWGEAPPGAGWADEESGEFAAPGTRARADHAPDAPAPRVDPPWATNPHMPPPRSMLPTPSAPAGPSARRDGDSSRPRPTPVDPERGAATWHEALVGQRTPAPAVHPASEAWRERAAGTATTSAAPEPLGRLPTESEPSGMERERPRASAWPARLTVRRVAADGLPHEGMSAPFAATTDESPPTIQVTIGRIDVRAITPPAPAPRPALARPAPALTLDDYLKRQSGGR